VRRSASFVRGIYTNRKHHGLEVDISNFAVPDSLPSTGTPPVLCDSAVTVAPPSTVAVHGSDAGSRFATMPAKHYDATPARIRCAEVGPSAATSAWIRVARLLLHGRCFWCLNGCGPLKVPLKVKADNEDDYSEVECDLCSGDLVDECGGLPCLLKCPYCDFGACRGCLLKIADYCSPD
jgi:hypothetical protein